MGRRKLSEEERIKSREKRLEYLRNYRKEHGPDYYKKNKERILKHQRAKREQEKGSPLNSHNKINLKDMTKEERNEYYKIKNRESRARKRKEKEKHYFDNVNDILNSTFYIVDCEDLVYFARKVKILGFESHGYNEEIEYISDISEPYNPFGENRTFYLSVLTQYKTFKEAQNAAKKLNNMPENKERLKRWIKINFSQEMLEFKYGKEV